jgi:F0F1-type ATP synthase assembly protein I
MLTPAAIWIGLGWLLCNRWGVGKWAMILAIVLGVISGVGSMFRFLMTSARVIDPTEPDPPARKEDSTKGESFKNNH